MVVHVRAALRAQSCAIWPAQRLERQLDDHRVTQQRLQVDQVTHQTACFVLAGLTARIDEQLLNVDLELVDDRGEAAYALTGDRHAGDSGDQYALDRRLQPQVKLNRGSSRD